MSVVKINAVTVPADQAEAFGARFAARAGAVENSPGFERFMLMKPSDDSLEWMVLTVWESEDAFAAWTASNDFRAAHGREIAEAKARAEQVTGHEPAATEPKPVGHSGVTARLLSFDVLEHVAPRHAAPQHAAPQHAAST